MNIPIKTGQRWKLCNGQIKEITDINLSDPMPVKSGDMCWQLNGRYWNDEVSSSKDLHTLIEE